MCCMLYICTCTDIQLYRYMTIEDAWAIPDLIIRTTATEC